jgi:hypothetical protein
MPISVLSVYWKQRLVVGLRRAAIVGSRQRMQRLTNSRIDDIVEEQDAQGIRDVDNVRATVVY